MIINMENEIKPIDHEHLPSVNRDAKKESRLSSIRLRKFDPNQLNLQGWMELGFSEKQSKSLLKYKDAIGAFRSAEDLGRSFVVSEKKFEELKPFIKINVKAAIPKEIISKSEEKVIPAEPIDLNSSDSLSLLDLSGIGPFYAGKIVEYRNMLGGFVYKEQLLELWKFDSTRLYGISDLIYIDSSYIHQLKINSDSVSVFYDHPYLNWNTAKAIVMYREQHGLYSTKEELKNIVLINDSLYLKLLPYLSLE